MLTIACVLKSGGIYDASWVARLQAGVTRYLPIEHRFVCLSDVEVPCERIPLEHDWPGWWSKIEVLNRDGPTLYFDLDTAITGDLSDIAAAGRDSAMVMLSDFYRPNHLASGVLAWGFESPSFLFDTFKASSALMMEKHRGGGDQEFIETTRLYCGLPTCRRWDLMCPGQIVSYKVHCRNGIPPDARVVCLHGKPKFGDMPVNDPVRQAWEMAA